MRDSNDTKDEILRERSQRQEGAESQEMACVFNPTEGGEDTLLRLNRELRTISGCNQALLRAGDEQTLLDNTCRIVCDEAGYRMAWVGYVEDHDATAVRPVAWAGVGDDCLKDVTITWTDTERGRRGLTGTAVLLGKTVSVENFEEEPQIFPSLELIRRYGYRSGIALPLKNEHSEPFGVLTIYSARINAFPQDEVRLLEDLSGDLAFGIMVLRTRDERKRAEEALRASKTFVDTIIEHSPHALFVADHKGTLIRMNQALRDLFQVTDQELVGKYNVFEDNVIEEQGMMPLVRRVYERGEKVNFSVTYDSSRIRGLRLEKITHTILDVTISPVLDAQKKISHVIVQHLDITERRRAEKTLAEELTNKKALFDQAPDGIVIVDTQTAGFVDFNSAAHNQLGYSREEFKRLTIFDVEAKETREETKARIANVVKNGREDFETIQFTKQGEMRNVNVTAQLINVQGSPVYYCLWRDITHHKKLEDAVKEAEKKYRSIFENASIGLYQTTIQGRIISANPTLARMFGCDSPQELIDFITDIATQVYVDPQEFTRLRELSLKQGFVDGYEVQLRRKDGTTGWVSIKMRPIRDGDGNVVFFEGSVEDINERKATEDALRKSEARYRELVEHSNSIILRMDPEGRITFFNEFAERFFGYDEQEILGKNVIGTIVPRYESTGRDLKSIIEDIGQDPDRLANNVNENMRRNGERVWIAWTNKPVHDDRGRLVETLCIGNDITQQKKAEESLQEREQVLRDIIRGSPIPQFVIGKDHEVLYWNEALSKYTGIRAEEMVGTSNHWKAFYAKQRPCLADFLVDGHLSGLSRWYPGGYSESRLVEGAYEAVDHFAMAGNEPKWLRFTAAAIRDVKGNIIGAIETLVDFTEQKEAEAALRKSEEKYKGIIQNSVEGIFQSTPEGHFVDVNPAMATMCGYQSPEQMITEICDIARQYYVNPKDHLEFMQRMEMEGRIQNFEHQIRCKDGATKWASASARAVRDGNGRTLYYEGANLDITEHKNLETQLLQSQKMEAIGTLAGGIAHDFNNILMTVMGYANLIETQLPADHPLRSYIQQINSATAKAANVTRSLLTFSRKQSIELIPQSTNVIIRDVEKLLKRIVPEDIEVTFALQEDVAIMADMTQIDQVLINLVSNAKDAMPKGGRLSIRTGPVHLDAEFRQSHGFGEPGRYSLISVSDTGCGMDEVTQKKIFEPFFTTKEVGKGTGLGLSIVYGIIKQHGGYITVSSEPGRGTTFEIYLPAIKAEISEVRQGPDDAPGGTETLLLAEDSTDVRAIIRELLSAAGYTVVEAANGDDAIERYREHRDTVGLLILDVVMPGKNGKEAYEEIRRINPSIRALFMSGYTGDVVLGKGIQGTVVDYIAKPVLANELLKKIREVLGR